MSRLNWQPLRPATAFGPVVGTFIIVGHKRLYGVGLEVPTPDDKTMIVIPVAGNRRCVEVVSREDSIMFSDIFWNIVSTRL